MKFTFILSTLLFGHSVGQNVVEVAVGAPTLFSTLVNLVVTAGLDGALSTADDITLAHSLFSSLTHTLSLTLT